MAEDLAAPLGTLRAALFALDASLDRLEKNPVIREARWWAALRALVGCAGRLWAAANDLKLGRGLEPERWRALLAEWRAQALTLKGGAVKLHEGQAWLEWSFEPADGEWGTCWIPLGGEDDPVYSQKMALLALIRGVGDLQRRGDALAGAVEAFVAPPRAAGASERPGSTPERPEEPLALGPPASALEPVHPTPGPAAPVPAPDPPARPTLLRDSSLLRGAGLRAESRRLPDPAPVPAHPAPAPAPEPPAAPARSALDRALRRVQDLEGLSQALEEAWPPEGSAEEETFSELRTWAEWLGERAGSLLALPREQVVERLRRWHRALDYHLAADPAQSPPFLEEAEGTSALADPELRAAWVERLRARQRAVRTALFRLGIERIELPPGASLAAGVVERSPSPGEPTRDPDLHGRVARIEPGSGGYRERAGVIMPSLAVCYELAEGEGAAEP